MGNNAKHEKVEITVNIDKNVYEAANKVFSRQGLDVEKVIQVLLLKTASEKDYPKDSVSVNDLLESVTDMDKAKERVEKLGKLSSKIPTKKIDGKNKEDVAEFFDEDFPEFEGLFDEDE